MRRRVLYRTLVQREALGRPGMVAEVLGGNAAGHQIGIAESPAGRLGFSRRTVQRRIGELMLKAGAGSRIQLGWIAARRGWA